METARPSLAARLWVYQAERFPLARTAVLCAVFAGASVSVSAHLAGRAAPGLTAYLAAFVITLAFFFQLRVLDEIKDKADDARFRPERPIPRGLVRLETIIALGVVSAAAAALATLAVDLRLIAMLGLAWAWMTLMSFEFFVADWLKARPFAYLVSHMAVMPLIDLVITGVEWTPHSVPPAGLGLFLFLSFANGCVLEIGRKLWAPQSEREGVETYSRVLGPERGGLLWLGCLGAALGLLLAVGWATGAPWLTGAIGLAAAVYAARAALRYRTQATPVRAKALEDASGLWVFACYAAAGFAPFAGALLG